MQKKMVIMFSLVLPAAVFLFSCKKNDSKPRKEYITASAWKFSQAGLDVDSNGTIDQIIPPILILTCNTDNSYTFKTDLSGTVDEGPTKCVTTDPQTTPFTWSLINNDAEINISIAIVAGIGGSAKILEASASKFRLSKKVAVTGYTALQTVIVDLVH